MKPRIAYFGFEIEGEFSNDLIDNLRELGKVVSDGSLKRCSYEKQNKFHSQDCELYEEEFVSNVIPYTRSGAIMAGKTFKLLEEYRQKKEYHWNNSCGFHIHLSFKPKFPVDVWSKEFAEFFWERLLKKHKLVCRNRKDNRYCRLVLNEEEIAHSDDRYRFINFGPAFKKHKTIEFRIFPGDKPMKMKEYLYFVFDTTDIFLEKSESLLRKIFEFVDENEDKPKTNEIDINLTQEDITKKRTKEMEITIDNKKREIEIFN